MMGVPEPLLDAAEAVGGLLLRAADAVAARFGYYRTGVPDADAPSTVGRVWSTTFAADVHDGDLVAVHADDLPGGRDEGLRALRVNQRKTSGAQVLGMDMQMLVLLCTDVDSGEPHSLMVRAEYPIRVCPDVSRLDEQVAP